MTSAEVRVRSLVVLCLVACAGPSAPYTPPAGEPSDATSKPLFGPTAAWNRAVDGATVDPASDALIAHLQDVGFGLGRAQIDLSIEVLRAGADAPMVPFEPKEDEHWVPDCDLDPVPLPPGGAIEGERGYRCTTDGDCHLLVLHEPTATLYEQWRVDQRANGELTGGCLAVWDLTASWTERLRGEGCTSADAAGLPIAPLVFDADEVAAGEIAHALRFILPNDRIRDRAYVRPATHATGSPNGASGGPESLPYGARLRLRADFPVDELPTPGARVVARALQRYGMILADGGNVLLTGQSDRFTAAKWEGVLGTRDLDGVEPRDFEVITLGEVFAWDGDCAREG